LEYSGSKGFGAPSLRSRVSMRKPTALLGKEMRRYAFFASYLTYPPLY
jgi:hypothetical protein